MSSQPFPSPPGPPARSWGRGFSTRSGTHTHEYIYLYTFTYIFIYIRAYTDISAYKIYTLTYIHIYIYVCIYIYKCICVFRHRYIDIFAANEFPGTLPHSCPPAGLPQPPQQPGPAPAAPARGEAPGAPGGGAEPPQPRVIAASALSSRIPVSSSGRVTIRDLHPQEGAEFLSRFLSPGFTSRYWVPAGLWLRGSSVGAHTGLRGGTAREISSLLPLMGSASHPIPALQERPALEPAVGAERLSESRARGKGVCKG